MKPLKSADWKDWSQHPCTERILLVYRDAANDVQKAIDSLVRTGEYKTIQFEQGRKDTYNEIIDYVEGLTKGADEA